ncbi:unnamed protein product [Adineta ricciae]|uniref:BED-type domain-containing protein n=1 Tax=Adineta ricciae TaxID=249248 RepID=A0A815ZQ13_ADIRI|nr:unnamed protein product [Adineta ricciae]CAF1585089.1 unnamed protein product [Adineta ricciae]
MGKVPLSTSKNLPNTQSKRKSDASIIKQPSSSSIQRRGNANSSKACRVAATASGNKENATNNSKSSSDISDDESMEAESITHTKSRQKSAVHEYASKISPNEYQCKLCSKIVRCTVDTNSNIRRHLALSHGKMQLACKSHRSPRATIPSDKKNLLDEAAINCIITDARCWNDFKRPGMIKFLSVAVPGYSGPSSRSVQRQLKKLYFKKQCDFKNELTEVENVSITTDLWRSNRCHHYLCITAHWLNSNYQLKAKILSFRKFNGRHLSARIRRHIKRILTSFNLTNKIIASTTDNGSNVKAATSQTSLFGIRFHCMAHALNLTIHKGLSLWPKKSSTLKKTNNSVNDDTELNESDNDISDDDTPNDQSEASNEPDYNSDGEEDEDEDEQFDQDDDSSSSTDNEEDGNESSPLSIMNDITAVMDKCRTIVVTIRKSSILHEFIGILAADSSIKADLIIDMRVRWNSSYKMLQRLLLYQSVLENLYEQLNSLAGVTDQQRRKLLNSKLNGNDWNLIQALRRVLERFDEATRVLSGQNYPTLSLSYAITFSLLHYLRNRSDDQLDNEIKELLLDSYSKYMIRDGKEMAVIRVSALLDPLTHDLLTREDKNAAEAFITKEINDKRRSKNILSSDTFTTASSISTDTTENSATSSSSKSSKGMSIITNFLSKCGVESTNISIRSKKSLTITQELAKLSSIPKDEYEFGSFWREHGDSLPKLASCARKYLSISSSSVASESAFSTSNYVLRKNRLALSSKNVKYTMFLKDKLDI